jgi:endonuclease-3
MTPKQIQTILKRHFPNPPIPLKHTSPYTLLIAVLLSAQCTDKRVNEVTPQLFSLASTPQEMVKLSIEQIAAIIHPCGLSNNKAKAIWHLSKQLLEKHKGKVPTSFKSLEALPGVGHKTASVVMIQAFGRPAFPVDTHIHRCAHRWGLSDGSSVEQTEKDLKRLFPRKDWGILHLQIIYFARQYCPARGHKASLCPICLRER